MSDRYEGSDEMGSDGRADPALALENAKGRCGPADASEGVMLCDWRGRCTWASGEHLPVKAGEFVWDRLSAESQKEAKLLLSQVVTLRESQQLDVVQQDGDRFRGWLWPLDSPDTAVCILGLRIPAALVTLTNRELACLELLALGFDTRQMAEQLDVSMSTIHTHVKHARDKLGLPSFEAIISFAARYCYPPNRLLHA